MERTDRGVLSRWLLAAALLALAVAPPPLAAAGVVTDCGDDRELVATIAAGGDVGFNCGGVGAATTIVVTAPILIPSGANVRIDGGGKITLSGGGQHRIFEVRNGGALGLSGLVLRDGRDFGGGAILNDGTLTISRSKLIENTASGQFGGAIKNIGALTIDASELSGNSAPAGYGGAIDSSEPTTLTVISGSAFANNTAKLAGGALANNGIVRIDGSTFAGNRANLGGENFGGGAIETTGPLTVAGSTFSGNSAGKGGAIYVEGGTTRVSNSTLSGNSAASGQRTGGGVHVESGGAGPGLVALAAVTLAGNDAPGGGGGNLYLTPGQGNRIDLRQSIVAAGTPQNCGQNVSSQGYNLESGDSCGLRAGGDRSGVDPLIGPLARNGGPTATHALLPGSPALETTPASACLAADGAPLTADQRGVARPQNARCDSGAYERAGTITPTPVLPPRVWLVPARR